MVNVFSLQAEQAIVILKSSNKVIDFTRSKAVLQMALIVGVDGIVKPTLNLLPHIGIDSHVQNNRDPGAS